MTLSSFVQASPSPLRLSRSARAWAGGEGGCDGSEMGRGSDEQSVIQDTLRSLLQARPVLRPALRLEMAIYSYQTGAISLGKAANLAGVSFEQMREILLNRGLELHLGPEMEEEEAKAELTTLRSHLDAARR